jgi:hypothetical protein
MCVYFGLQQIQVTDILGAVLQMHVRSISAVFRSETGLLERGISTLITNSQLGNPKMLLFIFFE